MSGPRVGARMLFLTWASPSHLFPMVPLALASAAAGHDVRVAAPPSCRAAIAAAGLAPVTVGRDVAVARMASQPELAAWREPGRWVAGWSSRPALLDDAQHRVLDALADKQTMVAEAMIDDLLAVGAGWRPDVVVADVLALAAWPVANALGTPLVTHLWGNPTAMHIERHGASGPLRECFRALFDRAGTTAPNAADRGLHLDPCPAALRLPDPVPVQRMGVRPGGYHGRAGTPPAPVRGEGRARVCLTGGVAATKFRAGGEADVFLRIAAVLQADVDVVMAVPAGRRPDHVPPGVVVAEGVAVDRLLPGCAAVIHHGGSGTTLAALGAGLPQLVLPQAPVLAELGERVQACGAGLLLDPREQETAAVAAAALRLLDEPEHRRAAERIAAEIATLPGPDATVSTLEHVAGHGTTARLAGAS